MSPPSETFAPPDLTSIAKSIVPNISPMEDILDPTHGSFMVDTPQVISDARMQTGRLFLTVKWVKRTNGVQPGDTVFTNSELKRHNPLLLCEFYERMLKVNIVGSKSEGSRDG